ncbi:hypothetical protein J1N35_013117, partial [Gossypium stocksii]
EEFEALVKAKRQSHICVKEGVRRKGLAMFKESSELLSLKPDLFKEMSGFAYQCYESLMTSYLPHLSL